MTTYEVHDGAGKKYFFLLLDGAKLYKEFYGFPHWKIFEVTTDNLGNEHRKDVE